MLKKFTESMRERVQMFVAEMQAETGLSVVEMILILVVIIALVLIFKTQLTTLVNDISKRSQVKVRESNVEKGEITAFLSLIFVLMISFVTAILESASVQAEKNQARLDMIVRCIRYLENIRKNYWKSMESLRWREVMKPVILRETADRQNALLWSVRNLAGSRRDSISHRSKRTGISGRRCQIYGRSVWDFDYSRIGGSGRKVGTAGNYRGTDKG
mgnify:CR=1 FL=1